MRDAPRFRVFWYRNHDAQSSDWTERYLNNEYRSPHQQIPDNYAVIAMHRDGDRLEVICERKPWWKRWA